MALPQAVEQLLQDGLLWFGSNRQDSNYASGGGQRGDTSNETAKCRAKNEQPDQKMETPPDASTRYLENSAHKKLEDRGEEVSERAVAASEEQFLGSAHGKETAQVGAQGQVHGEDLIAEVIDESTEEQCEEPPENMYSLVSENAPGILFGIPEIDQALPFYGLKRGAIHEWYMAPARWDGVIPDPLQAEDKTKKIVRREKSKKRDPEEPFPPITILSTIAAHAFHSLIKEDRGLVAQKFAMHSGKAGPASRFITWIGKESWPSPYLLEQCMQEPCMKEQSIKEGDIKEQEIKKQEIEKQERKRRGEDAPSQARPPANYLSNCLFIDPPRGKLHAWAIETALRSSCVAAVIAECRKLKFATTRKLSLAAKRSGSTALLIRPWADLLTSSTAASRWIVQTLPSPSLAPCWRLVLAKHKGPQPLRTEWVIEFDAVLHSWRVIEEAQKSFEFIPEQAAG